MKYYLLIIYFFISLIVCSAFAQPLPYLRGPDATLEQNIRPVSPDASPENTIIFQDDFSAGASTWTNQGFEGLNLGTTPDTTGVWEYRGPATTPNTGTGSRGAYGTTNLTVQSSTPANGFMVFDSDWLDNNGVQGAFGQGIFPAPHRAMLISPSFNAAQYPYLNMEFYQYYRRFAGPTSQAQPATYVLFSTDGGATWGDTLTLNANIAVNQATARNSLIRVNVSDYIGGAANAKIAFMFHGDYYFWQIDDVIITQAPNHDLSLVQSIFLPDTTNGRFLEYGVVPVSNTGGVVFQALIRNLGTTNQTNVTLTVNAIPTSGGAPLYTGIGSVPSLAPGAEEVISLSTIFTATTVANMNVSFNVTADSTDAYVLNNSATRQFAITDSSFSPSVLAPVSQAFSGTGQWGNPAAQQVSLANKFEFLSPGTVTSATAYLQTGTTGTQAGSSVVFTVRTPRSDGLPGDLTNILLESNLYTITALDVARGFIVVPFPTIFSGQTQNLLLAQGNYWLVAEMFSNNGANRIRFLDDNTYTMPWYASMLFTDDWYNNGNAFRMYCNLNSCNFSPQLFTSDSIITCSSYILNPNIFRQAPILWNTGATTPTITVNQSGWYWAEIDSSGCAGRDSVYVSLINLTISASSDTICTGDSVQLSAVSSVALSASLAGRFLMRLQVDMSQYNDPISPDGIRIAGDFQSMDAWVGNTALPTWNPYDTISRMTNMGNGIWSIDINFPNNRLGQELTLLFVNGSSWGMNEGAATLSACGFDNGFGGYNRRIVLQENVQLNYCWNLCTDCSGNPALYVWNSIPVNAQWSNGMTGSSIWVSPTTNTTFSAIVTVGHITCTTSTSISVRPCGNPVLSVSPQGFCLGQSSGWSVTLGNYQGNLGSLSCVLNYDSTKLQFNGISNINPLLQAGTFQYNAVNNQIRIAWFDLDTILINLATQLFQIDCTPLQPGSTQLSWWSPLCELTDESGNGLNVTYNNSPVLIRSCTRVNGTLTYKNSVNTPMTNTRVVLTQQNGPLYFETQTNGQGYFDFGLIDAQTYNISYQHSKPWSGANGTDALLIALHFVASQPLSGFNLLAGDVTANQIVNAADALILSRRHTGQLTGFALGDWLYNVNSLVLQPGDTLSNHTVLTLCAGDVNGSYIPNVHLRETFSPIKKVEYNDEALNELLLFTNKDFEIGAITLHISLPRGTEALDIQMMNSHDPVIFHQDGELLKIVWYSTEGFSTKSGEPLLRIKYIGPDPQKLELGSETELANRFGQPIHGVDFRWAGPKTNTQPFVRVYPNPSSDIFYLQGKSPYYQLTDLLGRPILDGFNLNGESQIDLTAKPRGMYFLNLIEENGQKSMHKLILK
jgi:hypothetical protein